MQRAQTHRSAAEELFKKREPAAIQAPNISSVRLIWGKAGTRLLIAAFPRMTFHSKPVGFSAGAGVYSLNA